MTTTNTPVDITILNSRDVHACEAFAASWRVDGGVPEPVPGITPSDLAFLVADLAALASGLAAERDKELRISCGLAEIRNGLQAQIKAAHAMLDEADVDVCISPLVDRIKALAVDRGRVTNALEAATKERDTLRAELAQTKAQLDVANADFEAGADDYEIVSAERDTARAEAETLRARLYVETEARRHAFSALASALSVDADNNDTNRLIEAANAAASHIKAGTETVNRLDLAVSKLEVDLAKARAERDTFRSELSRASMEALNADASAPAYRQAVERLRAYLSQRTGVDHTGADVVSAVVRELQGCGETVRALQDRLDLAEKRITRAEGIALE